MKIDQYVQVGPDEWEPNPEYEHLSDLATQIKEGHLTDSKSVDEVVDQAVRLGGLAQKTEANYKRHGREFMDLCGKRYVGQVNSQDAKKFRNNELTRQNSRTGEPLEKSYVKRKLTNLGVIFGVAFESEWINSIRSPVLRDRSGSRRRSSRSNRYVRPMLCSTSCLSERNSSTR